MDNYEETKQAASFYQVLAKDPKYPLAGEITDQELVLDQLRRK